VKDDYVIIKHGALISRVHESEHSDINFWCE